VRRYATNSGRDGPSTTDAEVRRAAERVTLACTALSSAVNELRVAHTRNRITVIDDAAHMVAGETERVCEMAEEVAKLASNLRNAPTLAAAGAPADRVSR
jgi:hypothetical protein